ncbi:MAG: hypothetical protein HKP09_03055 [Enterobacterales bacterium]|nr:hypothetical protein [Enterobacterales bacterium]
MRAGLKSFKEFHQLSDWTQYVTTYMTNTLQQDADNEIRIVTGRGETIAIWQKHGYGYVEECRSAERLSTA